MTNERVRLRDRVLPSYTKGEEIFNMVTHIVGGAIGIATLTFCVLIAAWRGSVRGVVCGSVFGFSMIALYTMSSVYHGLRPNLAKRVFQVMDHCTIYFLIAGTYTPVLLCGMDPLYPTAARLTFCAVWGLAILATTLTAIDLERYKIFSQVCYIGMGWAVIFSIQKVFVCLGNAGFALLLGGGLLYTVGAVFFRLGKKIRYFHSIFHIFVLLGSICHALTVMFYVLW